MSVYVDNMQADLGRMAMCHMMADSTDELLAMADRIGVARKWLQSSGSYREHFDICKSKRALAVKAGAKEVSMREYGFILIAKRQSDPPPARPASFLGVESIRCRKCASDPGCKCWIMAGKGVTAKSKDIPHRERAIEYLRIFRGGAPSTDAMMTGERE